MSATRRHASRADRSGDTSAPHDVPPAVVKPGSARMSPGLREALVTALSNWLVQALTEDGVVAGSFDVEPNADVTTNDRTEGRSMP